MSLATQKEFAKIQGYKSRSTVTNQKRAGKLIDENGEVMLSESELMIDVEKSIARINLLSSPSSHHRAHALQLEGEREIKKEETQPAQTIPLEGIESLNLRLKKAEADKREHEAEIARLDRELKEKKQIMADAVKFSLNDHTAVIRTLHENAPDRLTPLIHPLQTYEEKHAAISEFMEQVQIEIHESSMRALARLVSEE